jgi:hypothetical protein
MQVSKQRVTRNSTFSPNAIFTIFDKILSYENGGNLILSLENEQWALILGFAWWIKDVVHAVEGSKSQIYVPFKSQLASYDRKKKLQCSKPNQKWLSPHD